MLICQFMIYQRSSLGIIESNVWNRIVTEFMHILFEELFVQELVCDFFEEKVDGEEGVDSQTELFVLV